MTKSAEEALAAGTVARPAEKSGGFVSEWVVPVVLGLAIGGAAMWGWTHGGRGVYQSMFRSKAWNIVEKWRDKRDDPDEELAKSLKALGQQSRDEVLAAMRDLPADQVDAKIWIARLLCGDPWFATTSLKELVADPKSAKADRRAAACGLVDMQHKEVDTELVLPVFEEWLKDSADPDRGMAIARIDHLWRSGMLNSQWETRVKLALLEVAKKTTPANPDDAERLDEDRASALLTLELGVSDAEVKKVLWSVAKEESDAVEARVCAIRALSQGKILDADTIPDWSVVAKAKNEDVRQCVAENLFRATAPEFDQVIEPLQFDEKNLTRAGAVETQTKRRRPTMLARFDELVEDSYEWARFNAMYAAGTFKHEADGQARRAAMMLRFVESGDEPTDVQGAVLALTMISGETFGFKPTDVHVREQDVDATALATFMADKEGRKQAADKWRAKFGADCVWTDADRAKTLEKLLQSADPKNVERAKAELAALNKKQ